jgi:tRNA1Val (adenine37-N6)-methyltransferase
MSTPFKFKEFTVLQDKCAMKIGTDGVLLGAWATIQNEFSILDIGSGSGLISLMLAQRSNAELIDAIEIDGPAFEQSVANFENSDWSDRLFCYHASLQEFAEEIEDTYELIISNPPFYTDNYKTEDKQRNTARFTDALPFTHLFEAVAKLMDPSGTFALIIPYKEENKILEIAEVNRLFLKRACRVKGTTTTPIKRSLLEFSFSEQTPTYEALTIEIERHVYTLEYRKLVADFYLKM